MSVLDKSSTKPLYQQIIENIEETISTGQLQKGDKLPSERDLSQYFGVNRSTIVRAMEELHERNIVIRKVGAGTFVNPQKWGLFSNPMRNWDQNITQPIFKSNHRLNLANGDLPIDLYPALHLPEIDWQLLLESEQESDTAKLGTQSLRKAVQNYLYTTHLWQVPIEEILITSGTQQAISLITLGLLKTGDAIAIENPSYFYSLSIFQALGIRIYGIPLDHDGIVIEKLDELVHKYGLKMIFTNPIFQNPTGAVISPKRKQALIDYCHKKQLPIIEDDAYAQLKFHTLTDNRPLKMLDQHNNVIYLGSLSKYIGKSIRIGWMIAPRAIIEHLASIRQQLDSGLSSLPQLMAEFYLTNFANQHELFLQQSLHKRANHLMNWLHQRFPNELIFERPQGGFHLYATIKDSAKRDQIYQKLESLSVCVAKNTLFGGDDNAFRLSFAHFPNAYTHNQ